MNTNLNKDIQSILNELSTPLSESDHFEVEKSLLSARFISEIQKHLDEMTYKKRDLARLLGVSPSYITQVFRGEKAVNMDFLTKVQIKLGLNFYVSTTDINEFEHLLESTIERVLDEFEKASKNLKIHNEDGFWMFKSNQKPDYNNITPELIKLVA